MNVVRIMTTALLWLAVLPALAQPPAPNPAPTPLSDLLSEANAGNSQIAAADDAWQAAKQVPRQASALPDPTFTYQQFSVGSPKPFAGYTNSDFSYVGIGASQELPFPGKLRLRGEVARRAADVKASEVDATKAGVADAVKSDYLQLAYLQKTLGVLQENERVRFWDYTWTPGATVRQHVHDTDTVEVFLEGNGEIDSTTPDGKSTRYKVSFRSVRFVPRGTIDTEVATGAPHAVVVELK